MLRNTPGERSNVHSTVLIICLPKLFLVKIVSVIIKYVTYPMRGCLGAQLWHIVKVQAVAVRQHVLFG